MSFLDEKCIVFDSEDENKLEFTPIHNVSFILIFTNCLQEFKKLVEGLLMELMGELGVTEDQFYEACEKASVNPIHKKIVDQIIAVENFMSFKRLMVKRNTELNEQAMKAFENKSKAGATPSVVSATPEGKDPISPGKPELDPVKQRKLTDALARGQGKLPSDIDAATKKELMEVMRVANELERAEEEEMMKRAMEASNSQA